MRFDLVTLRPVQVASGLFDLVRVDREERLCAQHASVTRDGRTLYVLPGSSLKGALRSIAEAVSFSCFNVISGRTRDYIPRALYRCSDIRNLCPACRLFGMSGAGRQSYMGNVQVEDVILAPQGRVAIVKTPLLWTPARSRRGLPRRYLSGTQVRGRKFYFHGRLASGPDARVALPAGQHLHATINFDNLSSGLLGLLLTALGLNPKHSFPIKLGGGKPIGMGSVEVRLREVVLRGPVRQGGRLGAALRRLSGDELRQWISDCCRAAVDEGLLYLDGLARAAEIFDRGLLETRPMPSGPY
ncbi:MAG: RAMP superfamily CRISPR-associated protein [Moorellales bacterium]